MPIKKWTRIDPVTHRFVPYLTEEERNRPRVRESRECSKRWYAKNRESQRLRARENNRARRRLCLQHYSGDTPSCACCGETTDEFLSIDHINGGGTAHRRSIKTGTLWSWLKTHGFPEGFRVLCYNCNLSLGHLGYCPHEKARAGGQP